MIRASTDADAEAKMIDFLARAPAPRKPPAQVIAKIITSGWACDGRRAIFPAGKPYSSVFKYRSTLSGRPSSRFSRSVRRQGHQHALRRRMRAGDGRPDHRARQCPTSLHNTLERRAASTPMLTRSDFLSAHKTERRIELQGNVKIDDEQRHLTADKSTFFFDASRKIDRIESEGKIVLVEQPTGRKGTGDKATYFVSRHVIYMSGSPLPTCSSACAATAW
jgi:hypothetical protein